jgi:hypothetical protein
MNRASAFHKTSPAISKAHVSLIEQVICSCCDAICLVRLGVLPRCKLSPAPLPGCPRVAETATKNSGSERCPSLFLPLCCCGPLILLRPKRSSTHILGSGSSPRQMPRPNTTRTAANSKWPLPVRLLDTTHTGEIGSSPLRILLRVTTHTLGNGNWPLLAHHQFVVATGAVVNARELATGDAQQVEPKVLRAERLDVWKGHPEQRATAVRARAPHWRRSPISSAIFPSLSAPGTSAGSVS